MEFVGLKNLSPENESCSVKVRVCRLWQSLNPKKNGELISLDMVLIDEKGSLLSGTIRKNFVNKFIHLLQEGSVYVIQNFKVVENSFDYKVVESKFKVLFTLLTKVKKVDSDVPSIPMHGFQFVSDKVINGRVNDNSVLTDVIGCLTVVGEVEMVTGGYRKRDLEIITEFSVTCKVTLWGDLGENFNDHHIEKTDSQASVIIITSTRVKKFQGVINFSSSSASKIYVNLNVDYVSAMAERFNSVCPRLHLGGPSVNVKKTKEDEMFENRMDIQQLMMAEWSNKSKGYIITILGVIEDIQTQYGWFYLGCQGCLRKVNPIDGKYTCTPCNADYNNALTLYKLHLSVRDDTGVTSCVVLHKLAERMVDSSPLKLLNKSDPNVKEFPREITSLCGQKFVFCLQLSDYNINQGSDVFTVTKVFDPDHILEKKYKDGVATKENAKSPTLMDLNAAEDLEATTATPSLRKRKFIFEDDENN